MTNYQNASDIPGMGAYDPENDPHPANRLSQQDYTSKAIFAAVQLDQLGFAYVHVQPGDGTLYELSIVRPPNNEQWHRWEQTRHLAADHPAYQGSCQFNNENRYFVATSFGRLYGWGGFPLHPDYVYEKWTNMNGSTDHWTARVTGRFLTTLAHEIALRKEGPDA